MIWAGVALALVVGAVALVRWGTRWGSTSAERSAAMPGDEYLGGRHLADRYPDEAHPDEGHLDEGAATRVAMTRAISIDASPERVWPWLAQLGRGAGWYSVDWLDNGRRTSARHLVSWIPQPRLGDATAIGYLRHIDSGRALAWWADGARFAGARTWLVSSYMIRAEGQGTRLVSRMSADAAGSTARLALLVFRLIDSIMASRQLAGIRTRVEHPNRQTADLDSETGDRDQYQLYEVIYAHGASAGLEGEEQAQLWRQSAFEDGILPQ